MARDVRVAILGDSRDFSRAVSNANRDAGRLHGAFSRAGGGIATLAKGAALGVAGLAAGAAVLGKGFVDAATESRKVTAQTGAVIKSMGGVANVTAKQVANLSTKLSLKSGIDDELIQSGSNLLLTFGNIRNEVGKGNKIFDRANAAALDMSVALGTDMKSASMQVGKALNDPIKGIAKLGRAGIQFSEEQKKTIKRLQEGGDMAGAQAVMLKELERQFGGSAAAQATASDKLKVAWGNLQEQVGEKLLPVVERLASWLAGVLPKAFKAAERVIGPLAAKFSEFWNTLTSGFTEDEGTPIELFALKIREALGRVAAFVQEWWPKVVAGFQAVVGFVRDHWPEIQRIIENVMRTSQTIISGVVSVITTLWDNFGNNILDFVQRVWPRIQQVISGALEVIRGVIQTVTSLIKGDWSGVWEGIKGIVSGVWTAIQGIIGTALELIRTAMGAALEVIGSVFFSAWNGIVDWFSRMPDRLGAFAASAWNALKAGLRVAVDWIINQIDRMLGPVDEALGKLAKVKGLSPFGDKGAEERTIREGLSRHAQGGFVAGGLGQPRLILAHGGERVQTHGEQMRDGGGIDMQALGQMLAANAGPTININGPTTRDTVADLVHEQKKLRLEMAS